jgi:hypothetical protein
MTGLFFEKEYRRLFFFTYPQTLNFVFRCVFIV